MARRMWRPYPARKVAADVIERVLHTGKPSSPGLRLPAQSQVANSGRGSRTAGATACVPCPSRPVDSKAALESRIVHSRPLKLTRDTQEQQQQGRLKQCVAGGERYEETGEGDLSWVQLQLLDVYAFVSTVALALLGLVVWAVSSLVQFCIRRHRAKVKTA